MTLGHTRARYFPPENGGLIPLGAPSPAACSGSTTTRNTSRTSVLRYQRPQNAEWIDFTWRYDSGLVVSGVPDVAAALTLDRRRNRWRSGSPATESSQPTRLRSPPALGVGRSTLLTLPQTGTENDDHNPDRVKPRNLFNLAIGTDNLLHKENGAADHAAVHAREPDQQGGAVQLPVDLQRHPLRCSPQHSVWASGTHSSEVARRQRRLAVLTSSWAATMLSVQESW